MTAPASPAPRAAAAAAVPEGEASLREMFDLLRAGCLGALKVLCWTFLAGVALWLLWPPSFQSSGSVQVDDLSKKAAVTDHQQVSLMLLGTPATTAGETQILQSRAVLDPVIAKEHLEIEAYPQHFPIIGNGWSRWINNNGDATEVAWAPWPFRGWAWGGERIAIDSMEVPFSWQDTHLTLTVTRDGYALYNFWGRELLHGRVGQPAASADGKFSMLVKTLRARPGTDFTVTKWSHDDTVQNLLAQMSVQELQTSSGVIGITYSAPQRWMASNFVNDLEASYLQYSVTRRSQQAQRSVEFLQRQLPQIKEHLTAAQARLADYQKGHAAPNISKESQLVLQNGINLEAKRLELVTQLDEARQQFAPGHPQIKALNEQIASVTREQENLNARISSLPATEQDILAMNRELQAYMQLYNTVVASIESYQSAREGTVGNVRVVDAASEPYLPHFPRWIIVLPLSFALGLFLAVLWVFGQRAMLRGLDDPAAAEREFGLPVLAMVPFSTAQRKKEKAAAKGGKPSTPLLAQNGPGEPALDALRSLRVALAAERRRGRSNVVLLCAPAAGAGASFTTANLGALLAQTGARVAVVDADLRRGTMHRYFGAAPGPGVTDVTLADTSVESALRQTPIGNLYYASAGTPTPSSTEALLHPRFAEFVNLLSNRFDYVLLDAPPVLGAADAAVIGCFAGITVLVLQAARHRPSEVREALRRLNAMQVEVSGLLINQMGERGGSYGHRGYGYEAAAYQVQGQEPQAWWRRLPLPWA